MSRKTGTNFCLKLPPQESATRSSIHLFKPLRNSPTTFQRVLFNEQKNEALLDFFLNTKKTKNVEGPAEQLKVNGLKFRKIQICKT